MIVIDASVAVKWAIAEPDSIKAATLQLQELAAPSIWIAEAGNTLWRNVRLGQLTKTEAIALFGMLRAVPMTSVDMDRDAELALTLAAELDHPIYDCFYLALAIREDTYVVTADNRFASAVRRHGKWSSHLRMLAEL